MRGRGLRKSGRARMSAPNENSETTKASGLEGVKERIVIKVDSAASFRRNDCIRVRNDLLLIVGIRKKSSSLLVEKP